MLELPALNGGGFDYIETKEDLTKSQRIMQYAIEYRTASTPEGVWLTLVPPVAPQSGNKTKLQDRPAGFDQRDQYVGFRRINHPYLPTRTSRSALPLKPPAIPVPSPLTPTFGEWTLRESPCRNQSTWRHISRFPCRPHLLL